MKLSLATATALLATLSSAFPSYLDQLPPGQSSVVKRARSYDSPFPDPTGLVPIPDAAHPFQDPVPGPPGVGDQRGPCPGSAAVFTVDTFALMLTGGSGSFCRLNALANRKAVRPGGSAPLPAARDADRSRPPHHSLYADGYLPRSGIATLSELVTATKIGFNLAEDLSTVLSAISIVLTGNPLTMTVSIGGPDPRVDGAGVKDSAGTGQTFAELFGSAAGMDGHNAFETE